MNQKKKKILLSFCIIAGLLFQFTGIYIGPIRSHTISSICILIGVLFFTLSINKLYRLSYEKEFPEMVRQEQIEMNDERNIQIRTLAKSKTSNISRWIVAGLAWVNFMLRGSLWMTFALLGVFVLVYILEWYYTDKYQREM